MPQKQREDETQHIFRMDREYSEMVKFGPNDHEYDKVCRQLKNLVNRAIERREPALKGM